jgi:hypothetical protein
MLIPAPPSFPPVIEIELIRQCNLQCRMCQRSTIRHPDQGALLGEMVLRRVLEHCRGEGPQINLGGLGESLMHPKLSELLSIIKSFDPGIRTGINTNGLLLADRSFSWLTDGRLDYLEISLNAPDAVGYNYLTHQGAAYDRVCAQTERFLLRKGRSNAPFTTVHSFDLPLFAEGNVKFLKRWERLADFTQLRSLGNWAGTVDLKEFGSVIPELTCCDRPWRSIAVNIDGRYYRCCGTFVLGEGSPSVFDCSIGDYWNGSSLAQWRAEMYSQCLPSTDPCQRCTGRAIPSNSWIEARHFADQRSP